MAMLLRRPRNLARYSSRAAEFLYSSRPLYPIQSRPFLSLTNARRVRSYATFNSREPKPPNNDQNKKDKLTNKDNGQSDGHEASNKPSPGGNGTQEDPDKSGSRLSKEEERMLDDFESFMKDKLPRSQTHLLKELRNVFRAQGLPPELREFLQTRIEPNKQMTLSDITKLGRILTKYTWDLSPKLLEMELRKGEKKESGESAKPSDQEQQQQKQNRDPSKQPNAKRFEYKFDTGNFLIAAFISYYLYRSFFPGENSKDITWQEFRINFFNKGLVEKLTVINRNKIRVDLNREAVASVYPDSPASQPNFHYYFTIGSVDAFERKLEAAHNELGIPSSERIPVAYVDEIPWLTTALSFGPTLLLIGSFFWLSRRAAGGGTGQSGIFGIGKSRAKRFNHETDIKIRFADVAGMDEAKLEIMEFVSFLKEPEKFQKLGAKIPRGAILSGPPGTGKTLLAKATAGESSVPFFSVSGSEFVEMFVGVGPSRVRDLFANARKNTPCIIFIDEIDAIGKSRAKQSFGGGNDERESTLNQILTEMDGFNTSEQVVVLAGTNRPDVLDKALMRPGRFDRHIVIDRPTMEGRRQIFRVHLKKIVTKEDMDYLTGRLAALTPGFSGADIANCVNEAALVGKFNILLVNLPTATDGMQSCS